MKKKRVEVRGIKASLNRIRYPLRWIDPFTYSDILLSKAGLQENQLASWAAYLVTAFLSAYLLYFFLGLLFHSPSPMVIVVSGSMEPAFYRGDVMVLNGWGIEELNAPPINLPDTSIQGIDIAEYATTMCSVRNSAELYPCRALSENLGLGMLERKDVVANTIYFKPIKTELSVARTGDIVVYWSETQGIPVIHRAVAKIHAKDGLFVLTKGDSELNSFVDQDTMLSRSAVRVSELHGRTIFMIPLIGYVKLILLDDIPCFIASPLTGARCQFP